MTKIQTSIVPQIAIINAGGANFLSVVMALEKLGVTTVITHDKDTILASDAVLLPGVGSASFAMQKFVEYGLVETIKNLTKPLLGICLGMQLLYEHSEEGDVDCLGIIKGSIKKFDKNSITVPHMGWNNLDIISNDCIVSGLKQNSDVYFVHSFYATVGSETLAKCNYGHEFSAMVKQDNFYGMQFHPEKSGVLGEQFLQNFIDIVKRAN